MALYHEDIASIDLESGVIFRNFLSNTIGSGDSAANRFGVRVYRNGEEVDLSGCSCYGYFRNSNGDNIALTSNGTVNGNVAYVTLPQACYNYEGQFCLAIKLIGGGVTGTVRIVDGMVSNTNTGSAVAPTETVPTYTEILSVYDDMVAALAAANTSIAPAFAQGTSNPAGALVINSGSLYVLPHGHQAGTTWANTSKVATNCGDEFARLDNNFGAGNAVAMPYKKRNYPFTGSTGITTTFDYLGNFHISGTPSANDYTNIIETMEIGGTPEAFTPGQTLLYEFSFSGTGSDNFAIEVYSTASTASNYSKIYTLSASNAGVLNNMILPSNSKGLLARFTFKKDVQYDLDFSFVIYNKSPNYSTPEKYVMCSHRQTLNQATGISDLNNAVGTNDAWLLSSEETYANKPTGLTAGFLVNYFTSSFNLQFAYQYTGGKIWKRRGNASGSSWEAWQEFAGSINEYTFNEYSQTVTLNATPSITTDTNNYLPSSGDTTDRTADILAMLTASKVCNLGPGDFYISALQMPAGTTLAGSGFGTKVYLAGTSDGYAIKMNDFCTVKDLLLSGSTTDPTFTSTEGGRHGILWTGNATASGTVPYRGQISNVYIRRFTGAGIRCYDTGGGTNNALEVVNAYIYLCWAGIDIAYNSEYHKFTNVRSGNCRIGCVNNGGNNVFTNCDFSSNQEIAYLMDDSNGQSPNNSHGSCVGCVFNHTASGGTSNAGTGIKILGCDYGFTFTGCQIFYSKIDIQDSNGIVIADSILGKNNCDITVVNGGAVLFANNMFQDAPTISVTSKTHFVNCYNRSTGAEITA